MAYLSAQGKLNSNMQYFIPLALEPATEKNCTVSLLTPLALR